MLRQYQKQLRKNSTPHEQFMWSLLRNRKLAGFKFRRQQIIGKFIVDFVCLRKKLIIELDGGQHIEDKSHDDNRTQFLESQGFRVMRFWNVDLKGNAEKILDKIYVNLEAAKAPLIRPSGTFSHKGRRDCFGGNAVKF